MEIWYQYDRVSHIENLSNNNVKETTSTSRYTKGRYAENKNHYSDEKRESTGLRISISTRYKTPTAKHPNRGHGQGTNGTPYPAK